MKKGTIISQVTKKNMNSYPVHKRLFMQYPRLTSITSLKVQEGGHSELLIYLNDIEVDRSNFINFLYLHENSIEINNILESL